MSTKEARTRATRRWRQRSQQKLVQVYLHTDIVTKLDDLVTTENASGRAALISQLIQNAATCLHTDTVENQQSPDPGMDSDYRLYIPRTDDGSWRVRRGGVAARATASAGGTSS